MKHLLFVMVFGVYNLQAQQYVIDPAHTLVEFEIAHFKFNKVKGVFQDVSGSMSYSEPMTPLSFDTKIVASSIDTNNEGRDAHLKGADFFDVARFPDIAFKSKQVKKNRKSWVVIGDLTMHGVTHEVQIPFSISKPFKDPLSRGDMRVIANGTLDINRKDYGLAWSRSMEGGELFVGDEVHIEINCELYTPKAVAPK